MARVIYLTTAVPAPVGHGSNHRAYQVHHDVAAALGAGNIRVLTWGRPPLLPSGPDAGGPLPLRVGRWLRRGLRGTRENPLKILARTSFSVRRFSSPEVLACYERTVREHPGPVVCMLEHVGFSGVLDVNERLGIPTISCTHNLTAFNNSFLDVRDRARVSATAIDFANELRVLGRCAERLFHSKVEAGFIGGMGLSARYYPYRPVGEIRARCEAVRVARARTPADPGLFLVLGTAGHLSTQASFRWILDHVAVAGLPAGVRLVFAGRATDKLLPPGQRLPGVELRGWVEQAALDDLLVRARAVLVPQRLGYGLLTRLVECFFSSIPVVATPHATHAVDAAPFEVVDDDWSSWAEKLAELSRGPAAEAVTDYAAWEARLPRPLPGVLARLLGGR